MPLIIIFIKNKIKLIYKIKRLKIINLSININKYLLNYILAFIIKLNIITYIKYLIILIKNYLLILLIKIFNNIISN